ncbi:hypothetical protein [Legionella bozemanae]|uniref:hypothetical protein n=1 Tax=Legionella bozemanae TaxID=447 RepID=UPI00399D3564
MRFKISRVANPIFALVKYTGKIAWTHWVNVPSTGYEYVDEVEGRKELIDSEGDKKDENRIKVTEDLPHYAGFSYHGISLSEMNTYSYGEDFNPNIVILNDRNSESIFPGSDFKNDNWELALNNVVVDSEGRFIADGWDNDDWGAAPVNRVIADSEGRLIADEWDNDDWGAAPVNRVTADSEGRLIADEWDNDDWDAAPVNRVTADSEGNLANTTAESNKDESMAVQPVVPIKSELKIIKIRPDNRQSNVEIITRLLDDELLKNPGTEELIQNLLTRIKDIDLLDEKEIYLGLQGIKDYITDWEKNNSNEAEKISPRLLKLMEIFKTNNSTFEEILKSALQHKEFTEIIDRFNTGLTQNSVN